MPTSALSGVRPTRTTLQRSCSVAAMVLLLGASACGNEVSHAGSGATTTGGEELRRCRPDDGDLSTEEEIQSAAGCQLLEGDLRVRDPVTDLSPLSSLKVIEGDISGGGYRAAPFSLDALSNLEVVGGDLHFFNDNMTSFQGLKRLRTVEGWLRLESVPELEDLRGLEKVRALSRLDIVGNPKLRTLAGLEGLEEVKGDVWIEFNPQLPASEVDVLLLRIRVGGTVHRD